MTTNDPRAEAYAQIYTARLVKKKDGALEPGLLNVCLTLGYDEAWQGVLAYDQFNYRVVKLKPPPFTRGVCGEWTDLDDSFTTVWLQERGHKVQTPLVAEAVQMVADAKPFHPVRDWLDTLQWDKEPRLLWLFVHYLAGGSSHHEDLRDTESLYLSTVGTKWMMSAVARVYEPGCKVDHAVILEGIQGLGKSTFIRDLFGPEWAADTPFALGEKDGYQVLRGKWGVELAELDAFHKAEMTKVKAFISSPVDNYRPAYGRRNKDHPRQCVFAGTTNQEEYFRDSTGNRRFWPLYVREYRRAEFLKDRLQLWAEAVHLYKSGVTWLEQHPGAEQPPPEFSWWPSAKEAAIIEQHCSLREIRDPWVDFIGAWLKEEVGEAGRRGDLNVPSALVTTSRILKEALHVDIGRMDERAMATRVGRCMKQLGWIKRQSGGREARAQARFYYVDRDIPPKSDG